MSFEQLELRRVLDGVPLADYDTAAPEWFASALGAWVRSDDYVVATADTATADAREAGGTAIAGRWIVRLAPEAASEAGSVQRVESLLDDVMVDFRVLRGLGLPGQVVAETDSPAAEVRAVLAANPNVAYFTPDSIVASQDALPPVLPDDPFFSDLTNLHNVGQFGSSPGADVDAPEAWAMDNGSPSVVVGVIDSGVDLAHPDLYLNIWINQGEIPLAVRDQVVPADGDGRITFYDLNDPANAGLVTDLNANGYVDALDLLQDPRWADGRDTDRNGFVDDFFGWNFRTGANELFAPNNPSDVLGHGTHVAGTIGAVGDNNRGITGINWRSSIMALKFLDERNTGVMSQAIAAVHYATMMRTRDAANVRVLNNSWGQAGGFNDALRAAIEAAAEADILFVAAAGNGNVLGQGVNNDRTPFYPASYDVDNVIAVTATDPDDRLARFSNFGEQSVDLAAPGVGILSTLPGGRYGTANGTSMAAPHVTGVAALIWSEIPEATVAEVRTAILAGVDALPELQGRVSSGGRLNAFKALDSEHFAPSARLLEAGDIDRPSDAPHTIVVQFTDRKGMDASTLGSGEIIVNRQWGPRDRIQATLVPESVTVSPDGKQVTAAYAVVAPGGAWDALDYGEYVVSVEVDCVFNVGGLPVRPADLGSFRVQILDPSVIYVTTFEDDLEGTSLRTAIRDANAAGEPRTIILDAGNYRLSIPPEADPNVQFPAPAGCVVDGHAPTWSNETTGDLVISGEVTILGDHETTTTIGADGMDRGIRVYPEASLNLQRVAVTNGRVTDAGGGGILSMGSLNLDHVVVSDNVVDEVASASGGGISLWGGQATIVDATIRGNTANKGGAVFACNFANVQIARSTLMTNAADYGGGVYVEGGTVTVTNSTLSGNLASRSSSAVGTNDEVGGGNASEATISGDGQFVAFSSSASDLVPGDSNGMSDVFIVDRRTGEVERVSVSSDGAEGNGSSFSRPSLSADGRFVAFDSTASNLVDEDTNNSRDVFVFDRRSRTLERVSLAADGTQGNGSSSNPSLSADGRFVAFHSSASNLVPGDTNDGLDVFVYDRQTRTVDRVMLTADEVQGWANSHPSLSADGRFVAFSSVTYPSGVFVFDRQTGEIDRVSVANDGTWGNHVPLFGEAPSLSADGRFVAFSSSASNLVPNDTNNKRDVFVFDRESRTIERVSIATDGSEGNGFSDHPSLSADGRLVAFISSASNLTSGDKNGESDVFVFDRETKSIERASIAHDGNEGNRSSYLPSFSADGHFLAFSSSASDLVPGDVNNLGDVFVFDWQQRRLVDAVSFAPVSVRLSNVTVADNVSHSSYAAAVEGRVQIHNSLFAGNYYSGVGPIVQRNVGADVWSKGHNLVEGVVSSFVSGPGDLLIASVRNLLGPLEANGGTTWTHALLPGNPAIDAGESHSLATDQRGLPRPQDGDGLNGPRADIGAVELYFAGIEGTVFLDRNRDGKRDVDERGLPDTKVYLDIDGDREYDRNEPWTSARADDPATVWIQEAGKFSVAGMSPGRNHVAMQLESGWQATSSGIERVSLESGEFRGDGDSMSSQVSPDGRFVKFVSSASNLVPGDTNDVADVFVFDRVTGITDRVSVADDGTQGNSTSWFFSSNSSVMSEEGRYVAFESAASNLVPEDTNNSGDVFVFDRLTRKIERVSVADDGTQGDAASFAPSLSADGRFVAFASEASNLVPDDTNDVWDAFVFDRQTHRIERLSVTVDGVQGNSETLSPALSADGRFVVFSSFASNLVPGDTNDEVDVFVVDRTTKMIERVSISSEGAQGNGSSGDLFVAPSVSDDGRFVSFVSSASNLVPNDTNNAPDVFIFDREAGTIERVNIANDGTQANGSSRYHSMSADGRFVVFDSEAWNLVPGDTNGEGDVFVFDRQTRTTARVSAAQNGIFDNGGQPSVSADGSTIAFVSNSATSEVFVAYNPHRSDTRTFPLWLYAGQLLSDFDLGVAPNPGEIRGTVFEDLIGNGVCDPGDPILEGVTVYLDLNFNDRRDPGEPHTLSAASGAYIFADVEAHLDYQIGVAVPDGFSLVLPTADENGFWRVFLPAGGTVADRDFGFRKAATGGQFENALIEGRLFRDDNGNGRYDELSGESGLAGWTVFLDLNDDGMRQYNEPQTVTSTTDPGFYAFPNLGNRPYTVRVLEKPSHVQTGPVGNQFVSQERALPLPTGAAASPRDVVAADFSGDGRPDLAVALYDHNAVSLLLNDGHGRFDQAPVTIELAPAGSPHLARGLNPAALVAGDFNGSGSLDLAVVNRSSSNVAILLDFDGAGFASKTFVSVGTQPGSITAGYLAGENRVAFLAVANENSNTVSILRNDGNGIFAADPSPLSVGNHPASVAVGFFNDDPYPDLAVANYGTHPQGSDLGHVRVLLANGPAGFHPAQPACQVGMGPANVAAADLDGDGRADLAVANFLSNTVSVCAGAGDGTFTSMLELSAGSGPVELVLAALDGTGGSDILMANVTSEDVAILRNRSVPGSFAFEPSESFGAARFSGGAYLALTVADFNGSGLPDLGLADSAGRNISVHLNHLVAGAHRVPLTGVETVTGMDFALQPLNAAPTLNSIADRTIDKAAGEQSVTLSGISDGDDGVQPLAVTASSSNPSLVPHPTVQYTDGGDSGSLWFSPAAEHSGTATITVTVTDGGLDEDLATPDDNAAVSRTFQVVVNDNDVYMSPIPDPAPIQQNAPQQTVIVTGIASGRGRAQPLAVTVRSDRQDIIPTPTLHYTSPDSVAVLTYQPVTDAYGAAVITVTVTDGGLDGDLITEDDNVFRSESFTVLVSPANRPPIVAAPLSDQQAWTNRSFTFTFDAGVFQDPDDGDVLTSEASQADGSPLPAWLGFEPSSRTFSGTPGSGDVGEFEIAVTARDSGGLEAADTFVLTVLATASGQNPANRFDVNDDGQVTALDVLIVVNYLNAHGAGPLPDAFVPPPFWDVNDDGDIAPNDVLDLVNHLNATTLSGMGEAGGEAPADARGNVRSAMVPAAMLPAVDATDRVIVEWSSGPAAGHSEDPHAVREPDRLVLVQTSPVEEPEDLRFRSSRIDAEVTPYELEDVLGEIVSDIAEASLAS